MEMWSRYHSRLEGPNLDVDTRASSAYVYRAEAGCVQSATSSRRELELLDCWDGVRSGQDLGARGQLSRKDTEEPDTPGKAKGALVSGDVTVVLSHRLDSQTAERRRWAAL